MTDWDANDNTELLVSEHEILFCVRDLMKLFMEQQIAIHGRTTEEFATLLALIENRLEELAERSYDKIGQFQ